MPDPTITPAAVVSLVTGAKAGLRDSLSAAATRTLAEGLKDAAAQVLALGRLDRHGRLCRQHLVCAAEAAVTLAMVRTARENAQRRQVHGAYEESEAELLRTCAGQLAEALLFARVWADGESAWDAVIQRHMETSLPRPLEEAAR